MAPRISKKAKTEGKLTQKSLPACLFGAKPVTSGSVQEPPSPTDTQEKPIGCVNAAVEQANTNKEVTTAKQVTAEMAAESSALKSPAISSAVKSAPPTPPKPKIGGSWLVQEKDLYNKFYYRLNKTDELRKLWETYEAHTAAFRGRNFRGQTLK